MKTVKVNEEGERLIKQGFKTIYSKKIVKSNAEDGDWVRIYGPSGFLACGFYKGATMSLRIVTYENMEDEDAILQNLEKSIEFRKK